MSRTRKTRHSLKGGDSNVDRQKYVFDSKLLSTQLNIDPSYYEVGLIHISESSGINVVRGVVTDVTNFFGSKGVDNAIYDLLRTKTLTKLTELLNPDEKVCNLRMEFDNPTPSLLYHHAYGTLLKKKPEQKQ